MSHFFPEVGINVNYSQCALGSMSYSDVKELLTAIVMDDNSTDTGKLPATQTIPEEKLRKVLTVVLTGAHINSSLRTETAFEWYIDSFCESSLSNNLAKDVSQVMIGQTFAYMYIAFCIIFVFNNRAVACVVSVRVVFRSENIQCNNQV